MRVILTNANVLHLYIVVDIVYLMQFLQQIKNLNCYIVARWNGESVLSLFTHDCL